MDMCRLGYLPPEGWKAKLTLVYYYNYTEIIPVHVLDTDSHSSKQNQLITTWLRVELTTLWSYKSDTIVIGPTINPPTQDDLKTDLNLYTFMQSKK